MAAIRANPVSSPTSYQQENGASANRAALCFGDIVTLSSEYFKPKNIYAQSYFIWAQHLFSESSASQNSPVMFHAPPSFSSKVEMDGDVFVKSICVPTEQRHYLFEVLCKLEYESSARYAELTRATSSSKSGDIAESETITAAAKEIFMQESKRNEETLLQRLGDSVKWGDVIQLRHLETGKFLTITNSVDSVVELVCMGSNGSWFHIESCYPVASSFVTFENFKVPILLRSARGSVVSHHQPTFLCPSYSDRLAVTDASDVLLLGTTSSERKSRLFLHHFGKSNSLNDPDMLCSGSIVQLRHVESELYLGARVNSEIVPSRFVPSTMKIKHSDDPTSISLSLWMLIKVAETCASDGEIKDSSCIVLIHLVSGMILTCAEIIQNLRENAEAKSLLSITRESKSSSFRPVLRSLVDVPSILSEEQNSFLMWHVACNAKQDLSSDIAETSRSLSKSSVFLKGFNHSLSAKDISIFLGISSDNLDSHSDSEHVTKSENVYSLFESSAPLNVSLPDMLPKQLVSIKHGVTFDATCYFCQRRLVYGQSRCFHCNLCEKEGLKLDLCSECYFSNNLDQELVKNGPTGIVKDLHCVGGTHRDAFVCLVQSSIEARSPMDLDLTPLSIITDISDAPSHAFAALFPPNELVRCLQSAIEDSGVLRNFVSLLNAVLYEASNDGGDRDLDKLLAACSQKFDNIIESILQICRMSCCGNPFFASDCPVEKLGFRSHNEKFQQFLGLLGVVETLDKVICLLSNVLGFSSCDNDIPSSKAVPSHDREIFQNYLMAAMRCLMLVCRKCPENKRILLENHQHQLNVISCLVSDILPQISLLYVSIELLSVICEDNQNVVLEPIYRRGSDGVDVKCNESLLDLLLKLYSKQRFPLFLELFCSFCSSQGYPNLVFQKVILSRVFESNSEHFHLILPSILVKLLPSKEFDVACPVCLANERHSVRRQQHATASKAVCYRWALLIDCSIQSYICEVKRLYQFDLIELLSVHCPHVLPKSVIDPSLYESDNDILKLDFVKELLRLLPHNTSESAMMSRTRDQSFTSQLKVLFEKSVIQTVCNELHLVARLCQGRNIHACAFFRNSERKSNRFVPSFLDLLRIVKEDSIPSCLRAACSEVIQYMHVSKDPWHESEVGGSDIVESFFVFSVKEDFDPRNQPPFCVASSAGTAEKTRTFKLEDIPHKKILMPDGKICYISNMILDKETAFFNFHISQQLYGSSIYYGVAAVDESQNSSSSYFPESSIFYHDDGRFVKGGVDIKFSGRSFGARCDIGVGLADDGRCFFSVDSKVVALFHVPPHFVGKLRPIFFCSSSKLFEETATIGCQNVDFLKQATYKCLSQVQESLNFKKLLRSLTLVLSEQDLIESVFIDNCVGEDSKHCLINTCRLIESTLRVTNNKRQTRAALDDAWVYVAPFIDALSAILGELYSSYEIGNDQVPPFKHRPEAWASLFLGGGSVDLLLQVHSLFQIIFDVMIDSVVSNVFKFIKDSDCVALNNDAILQHIKFHGSFAKYKSCFSSLKQLMKVVVQVPDVSIQAAAFKLLFRHDSLQNLALESIQSVQVLSDFTSKESKSGDFDRILLYKTLNKILQQFNSAESTVCKILIYGIDFEASCILFDLWLALEQLIALIVPKEEHMRQLENYIQGCPVDMALLFDPQHYDSNNSDLILPSIKLISHSSKTFVMQKCLLTPSIPYTSVSDLAENSNYVDSVVSEIKDIMLTLEVEQYVFKMCSFESSLPELYGNQGINSATVIYQCLTHRLYSFLQMYVRNHESTKTCILGFWDIIMEKLSGTFLQDENGINFGWVLLSEIARDHKQIAENVQSSDISHLAELCMNSELSLLLLVPFIVSCSSGSVVPIRRNQSIIMQKLLKSCFSNTGGFLLGLIVSGTELTITNLKLSMFLLEFDNIHRPSPSLFYLSLLSSLQACMIENASVRAQFIQEISFQKSMHEFSHVLNQLTNEKHGIVISMYAFCQITSRYSMLLMTAFLSGSSVKPNLKGDQALDVAMVDSNGAGVVDTLSNIYNKAALFFKLFHASRAETQEPRSHSSLQGIDLENLKYLWNDFFQICSNVLKNRHSKNPNFREVISSRLHPTPSIERFGHNLSFSSMLSTFSSCHEIKMKSAQAGQVEYHPVNFSEEDIVHIESVLQQHSNFIKDTLSLVVPLFLQRLFKTFTISAGHYVDSSGAKQPRSKKFLEFAHSIDVFVHSLTLIHSSEAEISEGLILLAEISQYLLTQTRQQSFSSHVDEYFERQVIANFFHSNVYFGRIEHLKESDHLCLAAIPSKQEITLSNVVAVLQADLDLGMSVLQQYLQRGIFESAEFLRSSGRDFLSFSNLCNVLSNYDNLKLSMPREDPVLLEELCDFFGQALEVMFASLYINRPIEDSSSERQKMIENADNGRRLVDVDVAGITSVRAFICGENDSTLTMLLQIFSSTIFSLETRWTAMKCLEALIGFTEDDIPLYFFKKCFLSVSSSSSELVFNAFINSILECLSQYSETANIRQQIESEMDSFSFDLGPDSKIFQSGLQVAIRNQGQRLLCGKSIQKIPTHSEFDFFGDAFFGYAESMGKRARIHAYNRNFYTNSLLMRSIMVLLRLQQHVHDMQTATLLDTSRNLSDSQIDAALNFAKRLHYSCGYGVAHSALSVIDHFCISHKSRLPFVDVQSLLLNQKNDLSSACMGIVSLILDLTTKHFSVPTIVPFDVHLLSKCFETLTNLVSGSSTSFKKQFCQVPKVFECVNSTVSCITRILSSSPHRLIFFRGHHFVDVCLQLILFLRSMTLRDFNSSVCPKFCASISWISLFQLFSILKSSMTSKKLDFGKFGRETQLALCF